MTREYVCNRLLPALWEFQRDVTAKRYGTACTCNVEVRRFIITFYLYTFDVLPRVSEVVLFPVEMSVDEAEARIVAVSRLVAEL